MTLEYIKGAERPNMKVETSTILGFHSDLCRMMRFVIKFHHEAKGRCHRVAL